MYSLLNKTTDIPSGKKPLGIKNLKKISGEIFSDTFKITKASTVRWFQSRINHKNFATNILLYKI